MAPARRAGIVSNGGIRDTDEIIKQHIPVYLDMMQRGRGIRPGRNEIESVNKPVSIGGVLVNPGDVVVGDWVARWIRRSNPIGNKSQGFLSFFLSGFNRDCRPPARPPHRI